MADFTADFEAGSNGNTITTGAGEASATAWSTVFGTPVYDNAQVAHGTLAAKFDAVGDYCNWTASGSDQYGRAYIYFTANPPSDMVGPITFPDGPTGKILTDGRFLFTDASANNVIFTTPIALNQWVRIEYHFVHSPTVGQIEIKLFNNAGSSTPTETQSSAANLNVTVETANRFGWSGFGGALSPFWMDDIVANATAWPGPVPGGDEHGRFAGPQLLAGTAATVYTAPDSGARIDTIHVSNPSGSPVDFTLSIGADAAGTRLWDGYSIPADSVWERQLYLPLANGEIVQSFASTAGVLVLTLDGKTL